MKCIGTHRYGNGGTASLLLAWVSLGSEYQGSTCGTPGLAQPEGAEGTADNWLFRSNPLSRSRIRVQIREGTKGHLTDTAAKGGEDAKSIVPAGR